MDIKKTEAQMMTEPWLPNCSEKENEVFPKRTTVEPSDILKKAWADAKADPEDVEKWIAVGRAYRRQNMFREAIEAYSIGMEHNPFYALLYRHRGHSYLNTGRYYEAVGDFEVALRLDPSNFESWYHQGVSFFMIGQFDRTEYVMRHSLDMVTESADITCTTDWLWRSLVRQGKMDEAAEVLAGYDTSKEPDGAMDYFRSIQVYKGDITPEEALADNKVTTDYGVVNYYLVNGRKEEALALAKTVLEKYKEKGWAAFGYRGCEVEVERLR